MELSRYSQYGGHSLCRLAGCTLLITCLASNCQASDSATMAFIGAVLRSQTPAALVSAFICWEPLDHHRFARHLSELGVLLSTQTTKQEAITQLRAIEGDSRVTFIVDMACQGTGAVLYEADVLNLFGARSRWILLGNAAGAQSALAGLRVLLDSDVMAAERHSTGTFLLVELYRRTPQDTIIKKVIGDWRQRRGIQLTSSTITFSRRTNLQKSTVKAVMVVTNNDSLLHLSDTFDSHIDTVTKMNYRLFCHVADIVNASVELTVVDSWGYDASSGMLGYLHRGDADIGITAMIVTKERQSMITYIAGTTRSRAAFLFRQPPLSFVDNIFTLPFSRSVWLTSAGLIAGMGILLHGALNWESNMRGQVTWSDVALLTVGAVCQQGTAMEAKGVPGRIVTIFLFVAVMFLYTSYSASIVVLLQSSTTSIRTLNDLLHSGLTLGAHDIAYNRYFFKEASDPVRRTIYTKKVSPPGGPQNFLPLQDGIERVRTSPFAFHIELGPGYKFVWDTFLEEEKCNLQTIPFLTGTPEPFVAVSKKTALKEILAVGYRKVHERGLQRRENLRYYHAKPECTQRGTSFVSVGLVDFYSAVLLLGYGMLLSLAILLMEVVVHRRQSRDMRQDEEQEESSSQLTASR